MTSKIKSDGNKPQSYEINHLCKKYETVFVETNGLTEAK